MHNMKAIATAVLSASTVAAFVVPDEHVFAQIPIETAPPQGLWNKIPSLGHLKDHLKKPFSHLPESLPPVTHPLDAALLKSQQHCTKDVDSSPFDYAAWIEKALDQFEIPQHRDPVAVTQHDAPPPPPPHHGPPPHPGAPPHGPPAHRGPPPNAPPEHAPPGHHGPPFDGPPDEPPEHGPPRGPPKGHRGPPWRFPGKKHGKKPGKHPGKRPHHRPSWWHPHHKHHAPNMTIYEIISKSNFTTNLTKLIDEDADLVAKLNSTSANYTIFAPTDWAFKRVHEHLPKVPKHIIKKVLLYHILPDKYPSFKLIWGHTSPTLLDEPALGGHPQRVLSRWFGLIRGLRVNLYSRVLAANIPATNGLIHATSAILLPPPPALAIITHLPTTFSTLELGLTKTGLLDTLNTTSKSSVGGTLFAPTNTAFKKLGPRANAFLFSKYGEKFLKALLSYHVVPDLTLYSTAFYDGKKKNTEEFFASKGACPHHKNNVEAEAYKHVDLPTLLEKPIAVDIIRRGPWVVMKLNAFVRVAVQDALAKDGVIQVLNSVLLPPKPGTKVEDERDLWDGEREVEVDELTERLAPYVEGQKQDQNIPNWEL